MSNFVIKTVLINETLYFIASFGWGYSLVGLNFLKQETRVLKEGLIKCY